MNGLIAELVLVSVEGDIWDRVDLAQSKQTTAGEERVIAPPPLPLLPPYRHTCQAGC